jgi:hypothetical protein
MWIPSMDVFLCHWYPRYDDARAFLDLEGGFLLPYRDQFFIAAAGAVRALGLDPDDPDWSRIGYDWVHPADRDAWERLRLRREVAA